MQNKYNVGDFVILKDKLNNKIYKGLIKRYLTSYEHFFILNTTRGFNTEEIIICLKSNKITKCLYE